MFYGFIIIMFAWLWQWYRYGRGYRAFDPWFLRLFALGLLIVVLDTFQFGNWQTWANLVTLFIVLLLMWKHNH